jgi:3-hydroxypropanoate dehydrogenase
MSADNVTAVEPHHADDAGISSHLKMLEPAGLDLIFRKARSHHTWKDTPVSDADIAAIHEVARWGPTSTNGNPARFVFIRSSAEKQRLAECVAEGNVKKVLTAPIVAIVAHDLEWWQALPRLFPHKDMRGPYAASAAKAAETALRNGSLQGAYLMIAARALGFDVGAMSGFDNAKVDEAFFAGTTFRSNFLCSIGHADETGLFPRLPRHAFRDVCKIL